jgi:quinol monooxygenase YgiN
LNTSKAEEARKTRGYRGAILMSSEDSESGVIVTLWEDEGAREASAQNLFKGAIQDLEKYVAAPPEVKNYRLEEAEIFL